MSDATTEPKAKPRSLIEAIDFTKLVIKGKRRGDTTSPEVLGGV
jgi:hypothetical protein